MHTTYMVKAYFDDNSLYTNEYRSQKGAFDKVDELKVDHDDILKIEVVRIEKEIIESYDLATERK